MKFVNPFKGKIDAQGAFENIMNKVDDSKFTVEEKNRFNMLKAEKLAEFASKAFDENSIKSKSRRFAAYSIFINFFIAFWLVLILYAFGKHEIAANIHTLAIDWKLVTAFFMAVAFYFGGYYATNLIEKIKDKKK